MWNWVKKRLLPALWRVEMEARVELAEAQIADLRTRFTRFQNRENMRGARSALASDRELEQEAADILAAEKQPTAAPPSQNKLDLWKKGVH